MATSNQKHLETSILINATKEQVWKVLTELNNYENWNPFIINSEGEIQAGSRITNTMLNGNKKMIFKPIITVCQLHEHFEWLGHLYFNGLFDGRHYFKLEEKENGRTKVIQGEYFSGILSKLILKSIWNDTKNNFNAMNLALKNEIEKL